MLYPETVVCQELQWEYNYTEEQALALIENYKAEGRYSVLCRLIEIRKCKL